MCSVCLFVCVAVRVVLVPNYYFCFAAKKVASIGTPGPAKAPSIVLAQDSSTSPSAKKGCNC